jgi:HK97 family phage major capsid protein
MTPGVVAENLSLRRIAREVERESRSQEFSSGEVEVNNRFVRATLKSMGKLDEVEREDQISFRSLLTTGRPGGLLAADDVEYRDQGISTGAGGAYLTPQQFANSLAKAEAFYSAMTNVSNVVRTSRGTPWPQPAVDDSSASGTILTENTAPTATDPTFTTRTFNAFDFVSPIVKWSVQLAQDATPGDEGGFILEDAIAWLCGERTGRIQNTKFSVGVGTTEPLGLFTSQAVAAGVVVGVTSAAPSAVTYSELMSLVESLDPSYHPNATWMMAPSTAQAIASLLATGGLPIIPPGQSLFGPDAKLLGFPVQLNPAAPALGSSTLSIALGDFSRAYTIRSVGDPAFVVLRERFLDAMQLGGFCFVRRDGAPSGDFRALKLLQTHS